VSGVAMATMTGPVPGAPDSCPPGLPGGDDSLTARVLAGPTSCGALDEVDWTVVSGDDYDDPPEGVDVEVVPIRREFALSDFASLVRNVWRCFPVGGDSISLQTPHAQVLISRTSCQPGWPASRPSIPSTAPCILPTMTERPTLLGWLFERIGVAPGPTGFSSRAARTRDTLPEAHSLPAKEGDLRRERHRRRSLSCRKPPLRWSRRNPS